MAETTIYDFVGGEDFFRKFTARFYDRVKFDNELKSLYPEEDLKPAEDRLCLFLMQYWGGPDTYSQERGHPRLRMRHNPYPINHNMREKWLACALPALEELAPAEPAYTMMKEYFEQAALGMVNTHAE